MGTPNPSYGVGFNLADQEDLDEEDYEPRADQGTDLTDEDMAGPPQPRPQPPEEDAETPTPSAAGGPAAAAPTGGDQPSTFPEGKLPEGWTQTGPDVSVAGQPEEPPPTDEGYGTAIVGGLARGGAGVLQDMGHLGATLSRKVAGWTDQKWLDHVADFTDNFVDQTKEATDKKYDLGGMTMQDAYSKGVIGPWLVSQASEEALNIGSIMALDALTGPMGPILYGAAVAGEREARQPDSNEASIGTAMVEGGATMGMPLAVVKSVEGRRAITKLFMGALGFGTTNVASGYAEPAARAVATGTYTPPTPAQSAQSFVTGALGGPLALLGGGAREGAAEGEGQTQTKTTDLRADTGAQPAPGTPPPTNDQDTSVALAAALPTQGELPGVPRAPEQGQLPLRQPTAAAPPGVTPAPQVRAPEQPQLPLGQEQLGLPLQSGAPSPLPRQPTPDVGPTRDPAVQSAMSEALAPVDQAVPQGTAATDTSALAGQRPPPNERPLPPGPPPGAYEPMTPPGGMPRPAPPPAEAPPAEPVNPLRARQDQLGQAATTPADFAAEGTTGTPAPDVTGRVRRLGPEPEAPPPEGAPPPNERPVPPGPPAGVDEPMAARGMPRVTAEEPAPADTTAEQPVNPLRARQQGLARGGATTPQDFGVERRYTTERDHENPNQYVAKDEAGTVVAVGDTPEMAVQMARARDAARRSQPVTTTGSEAPAEPAASTTAAAKGAKLTVAADRVLDQAQQKLAARKVAEAPSAPERAEEVAALVKRGQARRAAESKGEAAETPAERRARIKQEVAEEIRTAQKKPASSTPVSRGTEDVEERVTEEEVKEAAPTRTRATKTVAEAEGREGSELKSDQRAASRTDLVGKASDLLHDVLEGNLKPEEASTRYGEQPAGAGRPRTHATLLDYVRSRIKLARDPNALKDAVARARRVADSDLPKDQKDAAAAKIGAEIERIGIEQDRLPDLMNMEDQLAARAKRLAAAAKVKEVVAKFPGTRAAARAAVAAEKAAKSEAAFAEMQRALRGGDESNMRTVGGAVSALSREQRVQKPLLDLVRESRTNGTSHDLHDYLDAIINNPSARALTPHHVFLAKVLKGLLPRGIPVMARDVARRNYPGRFSSDASGTYSPSLDAIALSPDPQAHAGHSEILLHEAIHAATNHYLSEIGSRIDAGEDVPAEERRHYDALQAIADEIKRFVDPSRPRAEGEEWNSAEYAVSREHGIETITQALTDPHLVQLMARQAPSRQLVNRLRQLGFDDATSKPSLWGAFKDVMRNLFGLRPAQASILDRTLGPLTETVERGARYRDEAGYNTPLDEPLDPNSTGLGPQPRLSTDLPNQIMRQTRERLTDALPDPQARQTFHDWGDRASGFRIGGGAKGTDDGWLDRVSGAIPDVDGKRAFRMAALPSSTTQEIVAYNRDVLPQLQQMRDVRAKMQRTTNAILSQWSDRVKGWAKQLQTAGSDFQQLRNDATMAEASLGRPDFEAANAHLTGDALDRARELQDRFDALPQSQKDLYRQLNEYETEKGWSERQMAFEHAIDMGLGGDDPITGKPFITPAERTELARIARSKSALDELVNNPDDSNIAQMMADRWPRARNMVQEIANLQRRGWINGDYTELARHGDYIFSWGEPESENYGVKFFERKGEAEAYREQFMKDNPDQIVSPINLKTTTGSGSRDMGGLIPGHMAAQFDRALAARGLSGDQEKLARDALNSMLLHYATQSRASRFSVRRRNIAGASTDGAQTLVNGLNTHASRMGYLAHGAEESRAYGDAYRQVQALGQRRGRVSQAEIYAARQRLDDLQDRFKKGDPAVGRGEIADAVQQLKWLEKPPTSADQNRAAQAFNEMVSRRSPMDGDESTKWVGKQARKLNSMSFMYHLMRPAMMAMQSADAYSNAQAFLGGRFGHIATAGALGRALRQLGPKGAGVMTRNMLRGVRGELTQADWNLSKVFQKRLEDAGFDRQYGEGSAAKLIDAANQLGMIDVSRAREMLRLSRPGGFLTQGIGAVHKVGANMMDLFAAGEHAVDALNRVSILKAAFELGMRQHGNIDRAVSEATDLAGRAMPNWSMWNKPRLATERGPFRSPFISTVMQYKIYGMHLYSVMGSLVKQATTSQVPGERAEAIKALVGLMATHSLLVGATANMFGVPVNALTGIWDYFTGKPGPHNYETDLRRWMTQNLGPTASEFLSRGALGLAGIDAHRTLKLSNMVDIPEIRSFDRAGFTAALATAATGAAGDTMEQIGSSLHDAFSGGDLKKAVLGLMPRTFTDVAKAYQLSTQGLTDKRDATIIPMGQIAPSTPVFKALGFNPEQTADAYDRRAAIQEFTSEVNAARGAALDRFVTNKDASAIRTFNADRNLNKGDVITYQDMQNALARRTGQIKNLRTMGINIGKRQLPGALAAGNF